jgi:hypothetical protein
MHPAALGFAALGLADAYMRSSSAANREVTGWSTSRAMTGSPSRMFDRMARLAGAEDDGRLGELLDAADVKLNVAFESAVKTGGEQ